MQPVAFLVVVLTMLMGSANAQVFRCKDASGKTVYSDAACGEAAQQLDPSRLNANVVSGAYDRQQIEEDQKRREAARSRTPPAAAHTQSQTDASNCPSEQEIKNMESSLTSLALRGNDKRAEREFLQAEVRRARACSKEGGNYSTEDWKQIKDAQAAQNTITTSNRSAARAKAEGIHAPSASNRENDRMAMDKMMAAQRAREEARLREEEARQREARKGLTCFRVGAFLHCN